MKNGNQGTLLRFPLLCHPIGVHISPWGAGISLRSIPCLGYISPSGLAQANHRNRHLKMDDVRRKMYEEARGMTDVAGDRFLSHAAV